MCLLLSLLCSATVSAQRENLIRLTPPDKVQVRGDLLERMVRAVRYMDTVSHRDLWSGFRQKLLPGHSEGMWGADWPGRSLEAYSRTSLSMGKQSTPRYQEVAYGMLAHQQPDGAFHNGEPVGGDLVGGMVSDLENKFTGFWEGNAMGLAGYVWAWNYQGEKSEFRKPALALGDYIVEHYFDEDQGGRPNTFWWCNTNALVELYRTSGERKYLDMALKIAETVPAVTKDSQHTHTYLLAIRGIAQACELSGEHPELLEKVMEQYYYFRDSVMWPGGGIVEHLGSRENYMPDFWYDEGCSVCDWLGLNLILWRITNDTKYMDMAERVALNHLPFNQDEPGGFCGERGIDFVREGAPWPFCCSQKGTTTLSEITQYIACTDGQHVFLNFFYPASAEVALDAGPVKLELDTQYPAAGKLLYTINPEHAQQFPIHLRIPAWSSIDAVSINHEVIVDPVTSGGYLVLDRTWEPGTIVAVDLAMPLRTEERSKFFGDLEGTDYSRVSVWKGPRQLVFNEELNLNLWKAQDARPAMRYSYETYDALQRDRSTKETPLKIGEKTYEKGLGVYAVSEVVFALNGEFTEFISDIGLDQLSEGRGAVHFKVCVDGLLMSGDSVKMSMSKDEESSASQLALYGFQSTAMTGKDAARTVQVSVAGAQVLRLCVDNGVYGLKDNYATWGDARLIKADGSVVYLSDLPDDRNLGLPWDWGVLQLNEASSKVQDPHIATLTYKTEDGEVPVHFNYLAELGDNLIKHRPVLNSYMKVE